MHCHPSYSVHDLTRSVAGCACRLRRRINAASLSSRESSTRGEPRLSLRTHCRFPGKMADRSPTAIVSVTIKYNIGVSFPFFKAKFQNQRSKYPLIYIRMVGMYNYRYLRGLFYLNFLLKTNYLKNIIMQPNK